MAKPLLDIKTQCDPGCKYPTALRVAMDDGTVQTYLLQCQPEPVKFNMEEFMNHAMDAFDELFDCFEVVEPNGTRHKKYRRNR